MFFDGWLLFNDDILVDSTESGGEHVKMILAILGTKGRGFFFA